MEGFMARPRKNVAAFAAPPALMSWAELIGEALGRGVARGINASLNVLPLSNGEPRRRGRPPKALVGGPVPSERRCKVDSCIREARSKGLCSAHYQADRRRRLQSKA
jgi:hypothetical protein